MAKSMVVNFDVLFNAKRYKKKVTQSFDNVIEIEPDVPEARTGTLTTRTDDNTGTLTMEASHGIITGDKIDIFWLDVDGAIVGTRRDVTVGTVSVNSVPIDLGSGTNLPIATTAIIAMVRHSEACVVTGNNVKGIIVTSPVPAQVVFADASDAELYAVPLTLEADGSYKYFWYTDSGITNPLSGDAVAKVFLSHTDTDSTNPILVGVGYN